LDGDHLRRLLSPRSIAVVGATERPGYAARLMQNLVTGGFEGELYPVSLTRDTVFGRRAYPSVTELPGPVDVVMIAVPAPHVPEVVRACGHHDVGAAVVISAGFSEAGEEGRALADELRRAARDAGDLPVLGPNGNGYASPPMRAWATTYSDLNPDIERPVLPAVLLSQSGGTAFGAALGQALDHGYCFRAVFSMGNEEVVTSEQLAEQLLAAGTEVVALVAEEFRDPPALLRAARIARQAGRWIVVLKVGRSEPGRAAAATHTAALAGDDVVIDDVLRQHGVVRVHDVDELAQAVHFLAVADAPGGDRALVLSHSGGLGALAADSLGAEGFRLPALSEASVARLDELLGSTGGRGNPADITMALRDPVVTEVVVELLAEPVDLLQVVTAGDEALPGRLGEAVKAAGESAPPLHLVWTSGVRSAHDPTAIENSPVPWFSGTGIASRILARCRDAVVAAPPELPPTRAAVEGPTHVPDEVRAKRLLADLEVATPAAVDASSVDELLERSVDVPAPWVLKVAAEGILHKAADGLLVLGLGDRGQLAAAAEQLAPRVADFSDGAFLLEHQHEVLAEFFLGCSLDPHFGPVVGLGRGGSDVEEVADVTWATCPLDDAGARRLMASPAVADPLRRLEPAAPLLLDRLAATVVAVSRWFASSPLEAEELEINPLAIVRGEPGLIALDAVIRLPSST
jgi:acetate---CoA ligase (ADP-forming)